MNSDTLELGVRWAAGLLSLACLAYLYLGIGRGLRRPVKPDGGVIASLIRLPLFHLIASLLFFGACAILWIPLPVSLHASPRGLALALGSLLCFPGLALILWGRRTLGQFYGVSTSLVAPLYTDHQLVTNGPYAFVRHPVYLGMALAALGGVLIYRTWTLVFLFLCTLALVFRARREEAALANRFGEAWGSYARRVPAWFPRLGRRH